MTDDEAALQAVQRATAERPAAASADMQARVVIDLLPFEVLALESGVPLPEAEEHGPCEPETGNDVW